MKDFKSKVRELQLFIVIFISLSTHDLKRFQSLIYMKENKAI